MTKSFFQQKIHLLGNRRFLQFTEHCCQMPTFQRITLQSQINIRPFPKISLGARAEERGALNLRVTPEHRTDFFSDAWRHGILHVARSRRSVMLLCRFANAPAYSLTMARKYPPPFPRCRCAWFGCDLRSSASINRRSQSAQPQVRPAWHPLVHRCRFDRFPPENPCAYSKPIRA